MRNRALAMLVPLSIVLAACGSGEPAQSVGGAGTTPPATVPADGPDLTDVEWVDLTGEETVSVVLRDNSFTPQYFIVTEGTSIVFSNRGRSPHNVVALVDTDFDRIETTHLEDRAEVEVVADELGDHGFYCEPHGTPDAGMHGAFRVVEAA